MGGKTSDSQSVRRTLTKLAATRRKVQSARSAEQPVRLDRFESDIIDKALELLAETIASSHAMRTS